MPTKLAQHLVARGLLPAAKVEEALRRQSIGGGTLDTVLLEQGVISEAGMLQALSDASGIRLVNLADFEPNHEVASLIPPKIAERLTVTPLSVDGTTLHVACSYPVPAQSLHEVGFLLGKQLELWVALECRIRDWIATVYKKPLGTRYGALLAALDPTRPLPATAPVPAPAMAAKPPAAPQPEAVLRPKSPAPAPSPSAKAAAPALTAAELVEATTLEESLTRHMVERLAQSVIEEPILLEVKKPPPKAPEPPAAPPKPDLMPAPNTWDRMETVVLDTSGYQAYAKAALQPAPAQAPRPLEQALPVAEAPASVSKRPAPQPEPPKAAMPPPPVEQAQDEAWRVPHPAHAFGSAPAAPASPPREQPAPAGPRSDEVATQKEVRAVERTAALPAEAAAEGAGRETVPEWSLAQAREQLKDASRDREHIIDVALRYARRTFDFAAAFAVVRGAAVGWDARGEAAESGLIGQLSVPLDAASVFRTVAMTRGSYVGPLPPDALSAHYLTLLGRAPRTVFLFPVEVKSRLVAILYGDCGGRPMSQRRLSDFILFCQDLPSAFQELIVFRKQGVGPALSVAGAAVPVESVAPVEQAPVPGLKMGWGSSSGSGLGIGRAASMPALVMSGGERPPSDFAPILRRLVGPDAAQRARAMAELARTPEASARVLAAAFPGPTAWSRLPVEELPEADELGPIPAAISRLGRPAAQALAPLLDSSDSDTRYLALLTAGNLGYGELVDGVLRGLFDLE
ncbi:MAG: GspE/PulE/PilB domain-containing protein, partial [Myxococcaceae bacterium]